MWRYNCCLRSLPRTPGVRSRLPGPACSAPPSPSRSALAPRRGGSRGTAGHRRVGARACGVPSDQMPTRGGTAQDLTRVRRVRGRSENGAFEQSCLGTPCWAPYVKHDTQILLEHGRRLARSRVWFVYIFLSLPVDNRLIYHSLSLSFPASPFKPLPSRLSLPLSPFSPPPSLLLLPPFPSSLQKPIAPLQAMKEDYSAFGVAVGCSSTLHE